MCIWSAGLFYGLIYLLKHKVLGHPKLVQNTWFEHNKLFRQMKLLSDRALLDISAFQARFFQTLWPHAAIHGLETEAVVILSHLLAHPAMNGCSIHLGGERTRY